MRTIRQILLSTIALCVIEPLLCQSYELFEGGPFSELSAASRSANFVDVNGDGWDDIFFSNGLSQGQDNELYINNGDGTFSVVSNDITTDDSRSDGASFADIDNDGDLDAFVVTYGFGSNGNLNYFYRNDGAGNFTYEPDIEMGDELTFSEMANWVDINGDQLLDLYVTNSNGNETNLYYENQGEDGFLQRTDLSITGESEKSRSVDWVDYDGDGDFDLFITNEDDTPNTLYRNDGPNDFVQVTDALPVLDARSSAGSSWGDVDNGGDLDLLVTNYEMQANQLFIRQFGFFTESTESEINAGPGFSFGSAFGDMDNDGDLDLFICNSYLASQTKNYVYINDGDGNFSRDTLSAIALQEGYTFGCAFGDYDNDGWLDLIMANTLGESQSNTLYHNTGSGNNWIKIHCLGTASNHSAVGATLYATTTIGGEEVIQVRQIRAAEGYCSQNSFTQHFGLGDAETVGQLQILWPSGLVETINDVQANATHVIEEGNGIINGLKELESERMLSIHPNPVGNEIWIDMVEPMNGPLRLSIVDMKGDRVFRRVFAKTDGLHLTDLDLRAGEYVLHIENGRRQVSGQIIIK